VPWVLLMGVDDKFGKKSEEARENPDLGFFVLRGVGNQSTVTD